jgi:hypothetical protein
MPVSALNAILKAKYPQMRSWRLRKNTGGSFRKLCKNVRKVLQLLSGKRIVLMLKSVLKKNEKIELLSNHVNA